MKNTFLFTLIFAGVVLVSCGGTKECTGGYCDWVDTFKVYEISEIPTKEKRITQREATNYFLPKGFIVPNGYRVIDSSPNTISLEQEGVRYTESEFYSKYEEADIKIDGADGYSAKVYAALDEKAKGKKDTKAIVILTKKI